MDAVSESLRYKKQDWEWDDDGYESIIPEECRWANWAHDDKSGKAMTGDALLDYVNNILFPTLKKLPVDATPAHYRAKTHCCQTGRTPAAVREIKMRNNILCND